MTGTADTEAYEFQEIYGLETVVIPPNRISRRDDQLDRVYKSTREKYLAAITDIRECYERGQPVLVGTTSIENSEIIAQLLEQEKLPHQVLNAARPRGGHHCASGSSEDGHDCHEYGRSRYRYCSRWQYRKSD